MVSLNESMASRLFQWSRDLDLIELKGSWKSQPHPVKEKFRALANRLHNFLGAAGYPEGDYVIVPEDHYKVRPYVRPYASPEGHDQVHSGAGGDGPADPDEVQAAGEAEAVDNLEHGGAAGVPGDPHADRAAPQGNSGING